MSNIHIAIDIAREELLAWGEIQPGTLQVLDTALSSFCAVMGRAGVVYTPTLAGITQLELEVFKICRGAGISEIQYWFDERHRLEERVKRSWRYARATPPLVLRVEPNKLNG